MLFLGVTKERWILNYLLKVVEFLKILKNLFYHFTLRKIVSYKKATENKRSRGSLCLTHVIKNQLNLDSFLYVVLGKVVYLKVLKRVYISQKDFSLK